MNKKLILLVLAAMFVMAIAPAYAIADKEFQIGSESNAIVIDYPKLEYYKLNDNITFNVHVNTNRGVPQANTNDDDNVTCIMHIYDMDGVKVREDTLVYDGDYDFYNLITDEQNVTGVLGRHTYRVWCGYYGWKMDPRTQEFVMNLTAGGWVSSYFEVTPQGLAPPTDIMLLFSYFLFIGVIVLFIYMFVYSANKFSKLQFDITDLTYNLLVYIGLFITYIFNAQYFGIVSFNGIILTLLATGGLTLIAVPIYFFVMCYFKNLLDVRMGGKGGGL